MSSTRTIAFIVALLACGAMLGSGYLMARRIGAFHRENPREIFAFQRIDYREFEFAGRKVTLTDEEQDGIKYLRVTYGDAQERLLVTVPIEAKLPGLAGHERWMRALMFSSAMGKRINEVQADLASGKVKPRLAIVTRTPPPGQPEAYEGRLNPKAWVFDFYEFKPEGGFEHQRLGFPTTKQHQPDKPGELRENTWEYQAALSVIPEGIAPKPKFTNDGLKAAGWTLPATSLSTLVMLGAIGFAAAVGKRRVQVAAA
ncbi:MAG: hypothetical protein AMXMBFR58_25310 [Phycisphaerae bacterium]|nr:hypothetical protein [Phycisphaerales bacterium]MCK6478447.1 hypothetical protein [Phycisphaerales bacterium]